MHEGIVMDGNERRVNSIEISFAKRHQLGLTVKSRILAAQRFGIKCGLCDSFSSENWNRTIASESLIDLRKMPLNIELESYKGDIACSVQPGDAEGLSRDMPPFIRYSDGETAECLGNALNIGLDDDSVLRLRASLRNWIDGHRGSNASLGPHE
jgi:undecaprenyl diphosphate synthase